MVRMNWFRLMAATVVCLAASSAATAQVKVAVINSQKAVLDTAEIKKAQAELEAKYKGRQDSMLKLQSEVQQIQNQLQTMSGKLTPQAEQDLTTQGQRKQRELQRITEDLQADVDRDRNDVLQRAGQRMQDVVKKLSEERGFDVVVDVGNTIYFKPALEITTDAVTAYNKAFPAK